MRRIFIHLILLSAIALPGAVEAQYARTLEPDIPHNWEAEVTPPPADEWVKNMPPGRLPRALPGHPVRAFYLIPSNRAAMPDAVARIRQYLIYLQDFYREQMERNGFGPKTLSIETEADNVTPKVHIVNGPNLDSYYRADPWGRVAVAAQNAGLPVWGPGQVWLGIFEGHVMNPDGSITGEFNGGANFGSGSDAGLGITNSNSLALAVADRLTSNASYGGVIIPELGPYPMVQGVTAPGFDGPTIGHLASVRFGVVIHELSHGFGLPHDFRNDSNFNGNLLGNGFRGFRSWVHPGSFPGEETRLSYSDALVLNVSRYFNSGMAFNDNTRPIVNVATLGNVNPVDGQLQINFTASDAGGLAAATVLLDGNTIAETVLSGTSANAGFITPFYEAGVSKPYTVNVFDQQGNKRSVSVNITVAAGSNLAPRPSFQVSPSVVMAGSSVLLNASASADPDHSTSQLMVEWDLDNDGTFDTEPSSNMAHVATFATPGTYLVRCRVSDPAGAASVSTPIGVRVVGTQSGVSGWELY